MKILFLIKADCFTYVYSLHHSNVNVNYKTADTQQQIILNPINYNQFSMTNAKISNHIGIGDGSRIKQWLFIDGPKYVKKLWRQICLCHQSPQIQVTVLL